MADIDITSANSTLIITVSALANASVAMEGYAVDNAWALDDAETAVAQVGVDAKMTAGWVPRLNPLTLSFAPNSPSVATLSAIITAQDANMTIYTLQGVLSCPSIGKSWTLSNGVLTRGKMIPDGSRILGPQSFQLTFESARPAVL